MKPLGLWSRNELFSDAAPHIWRAMAGLSTAGEALAQVGLERRKRSKIAKGGERG